MPQVENAGVVKASYTEQRHPCRFMLESVLCTCSVWTKSMKKSCTGVRAGTCTLLRLCLPVILPVAH